MSREIKFRAWKKPTDEYRAYFLDHYGHELEPLCCDSYNVDDLFDDTWIDTGYYDEIIVEQYTGLKDKNGKEIYEGDIIKGRFGNYTEVVFDEMKDSDCEYYYLGWGVKDKFGEVLSLYDCTNDEVVGNIHENPELLETKNDN